MITGFSGDYAFKEYLWFFFTGGGMGLGVAYLFAHIAGLKSNVCPV
jgi:hypothetical protein